MTRESTSQTQVFMDAPVTIRIVGGDGDDADRESISRAFDWFAKVEAACSRFDESSELRRLSMRVGEAVPASALLFEAVRFALRVARASDGAFDPTIGLTQAWRGFDRDYRTGVVTTVTDPGETCSYRDVRLSERSRAITLRRPLVLDLGAVAKGFAIDLAARELQSYSGFAIDAGGDVFAHGDGPAGGPWRVGIRHPRRPDELIGAVSLSDAAICTSGDYERPASGGAGGHHVVDPRTGASPEAIASLTVIAPNAMLADALATAAFVLGPTRGLALLASEGVEGLAVTPSLEQLSTAGFARYWT